MRVKLELDGFEEMRRLLRELPKASQDRVMRPSMRAAARYIATREKEETPVGPKGNLKRGGGYVRQSRDPGPYRVAYKVGYRSRIAPHALIVDQGTKERRTKSGARRGRMPASLWFDRTFTAATRGAVLVMKQSIGRRLVVEAKRFRAGELTARGTLRRRR